MIDIVTSTLQSLWQVVAAGILLGAGLPALFALGLRSWNVGRTANPDGTVSGTAPTASRAIAVVPLRRGDHGGPVRDRGDHLRQATVSH